MRNKVGSGDCIRNQSATRGSVRVGWGGEGRGGRDGRGRGERRGGGGGGEGRKRGEGEGEGRGGEGEGGDIKSSIEMNVTSLPHAPSTAPYAGPLACQPMEVAWHASKTCVEASTI